MESEKGIKYDDEKPRWDLMDFSAIEDEVKVMTHGAKKYSDDNWKSVRPFAQRYFSACMRHITALKAFLEDPENNPIEDEESGISHIAHARCCLMFLDWGIKNGRKRPKEEHTGATKKVTPLLLPEQPEGDEEDTSEERNTGSDDSLQREVHRSRIESWKGQPVILPDSV